MNASRVEAFSDGVLAIVITIMVLSLPHPHGGTFRALHGAAPALLAYVLSFVYLGIYWNNHHHLLKTVTRVSAGLRDAIGRDWKGRVSLLGYLVSIPLALWWRWGSVALFAGVAVLWLIPDRRVETYLLSRPDE